MKADLIPMRLECGVVIWHSRDQYERFFKGVDVEAAKAHDAPIELEVEDEEDDQ